VLLAHLPFLDRGGACDHSSAAERRLGASEPAVKRNRIVASLPNRVAANQHLLGQSRGADLL
jgi:hypothetical protein